MKTILIIVTIILVLFLLIIFPFRVRFQGHVNLLANICVYSAKILFVPLLVGRCKVTIKDGLVFENAINKLANDEKHPHLMDIYTEQIIKRLVISKLDLYFTFGDSADAGVTAMVCGTMQTLSSILISVVLNRNKYASITQDIAPSYTEDVFELTAQLSLKISLLDVFKSYFIAKKVYKNKYEMGE